MKKPHIMCVFGTRPDAVKMCPLVLELKRLARPGDVILFKGSRGMHMELALEMFFSDEK